ncbi:MAG TPA: DoxX family protein [Chloroflexia bacterium]|nr:DoxX family protein [Chloroflexia bacterium]
MKDVGLLVLRVVVGGLMTGHGAQKLFGWWGGNGLEGTAGWLESMGMKPGKPWAIVAGASEFGGGVLTLLGFLNPLGPLGTIGSMSMATAKVHWGKPIWVTSGGAELPVTNIAAALALAMAGPGKISVDSALGLRLPRRLILVPGLAAAAAGVAAGVIMSRQPEQQTQPQEQEGADVTAGEAVRAPAGAEQEMAASEPERVSGAELQAGEDAAHPV